MEQNHPLNEMLTNTIERIRETVDANTVVGTPIQAGEVTLIPVSKISFGFGTGGSEIGKKDAKSSDKYPFGGGGGAGVKVTPLCFLVVNGADVRVLPMEPPAAAGGIDQIMALIPEVTGKVSEFMEKRKKSKEVDLFEEDI